MMEALLKSCRKTFLIVALFSAVINLLMLSVPVYTLQLYDRVLASQSSDTLIYLCFIVVACLIVYAVLEWLRGRVLVELSHWLDNQLSPYLLSRSVDRALLGNRYGFEAQRDIAIIKNFLKSPSAFTLLDMPWFPIFLIVIFLSPPYWDALL